MSDEAVTSESMNKPVKKYYDDRLINVYSRVVVLLIYWKDADNPGFKREADQLQCLFESTFRYTVMRFEIPTENPDLELDAQIHQLVSEFCNPHSLIIIHYGGHGDPDKAVELKKRRRRGVWASSSNGTSLNWSDIQPKLGWTKADVLVILDCCYGAQAARDSGDRTIPENVEFVAAAPMGCMTPGPGKTSFTTILMRALENAISMNGYAQIREIVNHLATGSQGLFQSPIIYARPRADIRLEPFPLPGAKTPKLYPETTLTIRMMIRKPLGTDLLNELLAWMTSSAPRDVSGIDIKDLVHKASAIQDFVLQKPSQTSSSAAKLDALPLNSKEEVRKAWNVFKRGVHESFLALVPSIKKTEATSQSQDTSPFESRFVDNEMFDNEIDLTRFIHDFGEAVTRLERILERNILSTPELSDERFLEQAIADSSWQDLNLENILRIRLENCRLQTDRGRGGADYSSLVEPFKGLLPASRDALVEEQHPSLGRVLIEYSPVPISEPDSATMCWNNARMDHLVTILGVSPERYRSPRCIGWTLDKAPTPRTALIFEPPYNGDYAPVALLEILRANDRGENRFRSPTLGQRFVLAKAIGLVLQRWHTANVVHQRINSHNIVFFKNRTNGKVEYSEPYLCGFGFTRLVGKYSKPRPNKEDIVRDLYQHPDRQGYAPRCVHTKIHDMYSYGVLLFEIGLWCPLEVHVQKIISENKPREVPGRLLRKLSNLGEEMGTVFEGAVKTCLEMDFGIKADDEMQSNLSRAFETKVLDRLDVGVGLDAPS